MISGPSPAPKTRHLPFNRTKSRVATGFLTEYNILRKMGVTNSPFCRRCGAEDETSAHILCECEALRHVYLGFFFLDPENIKSSCLRAIWNFTKEQGSSELVSDYGA